MTPDQQIRLIAAFNNISDLLPENEFADILEQTIRLFNGKAGELKEELMPPKGYKKANAKKKDETSSAVQTPTNVVVPAIDPAEREKLITEWKRSADALVELKAKEHTLRQTLVAQLFDGAKLEGSENIEVGYGWLLRSVKDQNYSATDDNGETKALIELLKLRDPALAETIIRWKPEVSKKVYKQVVALAKQYSDNEVLAALHAAITIKPGMPTLELVPPKTDAPVAQPVAEVLPPSTPVPELAMPVWSPEQAFIEDGYTPDAE